MQRNEARKKSFDLAPEIHALAKMKELGEFRKIYPLSKSNTALFGVGFMCVLIGVFLLVLTILVVSSWTSLYLSTGTVSGIILFSLKGRRENGDGYLGIQSDPYGSSTGSTFVVRRSTATIYGKSRMGVG